MEAVASLYARSPRQPTVELVRWEKLPFVERLRKFQRISVLVSPVGTAQSCHVPAATCLLPRASQLQMSTCLLPRAS